MRVSCMQDKLARGISTVSRAVASRSTLPVLSNILISAEEGRLRLAATNLEIGITTWVESEVQEEGSTTLPAKLFADLVNQSPPEKIQMTLREKGQEVAYHCASVDSVIKGIAANEFPVTASPEGDPTAYLSAPLFREMIDQVAFTAATDESRPILTGVLFELSENRLRMAAADGFRLSIRTAPLEQTLENPVSIIIPARSLSELSRIIGDSEGTVEITIPEAGNRVHFRVDSVDLTSQTIKGNFPDVQRLIPNSYGTRTVADTGQLLKAVRRAYIFARDAANIIHLRVGDTEPGTPGQLTLSAEASNIGENVEELVVTVEGQGMLVAFNAKYMMDVLNVINSAQVAIETNTSSTPGVIRPVGSEGFTHVIMPMHLPEG